MTVRTLALLSICCLGAWGAAIASAAPAKTHKRAQAKVTVQSSKAEPYDQAGGPALMEISIKEAFTGDIEGESWGRALQIQNADRSARMFSLQRVRGKLAGREGSFVLQGDETVANGKINATWFVVPGSGTGELSGLRGQGGFGGDFGKGSEATLDYWFERAPL
jgi:hypothetical protein